MVSDTAIAKLADLIARWEEAKTASDMIAILQHKAKHCFPVFSDPPEVDNGTAYLLLEDGSWCCTCVEPAATDRCGGGRKPGHVDVRVEHGWWIEYSTDGTCTLGGFPRVIASHPGTGIGVEGVPWGLQPRITVQETLFRFSRAPDTCDPPPAL